MLRDSAKTENSIAAISTTGVVESTTRIARRANRVLQLITREADNSEDPLYVDRMNDAVKALRSSKCYIIHMVFVCVCVMYFEKGFYNCKLG